MINPSNIPALPTDQTPADSALVDILADDQRALERRPQFPVTVGQIASFIGASETTTYAYWGHRRATFVSVVKLVICMARNGCPRLLRYIAHLSGYTIVPRPAEVAPSDAAHVRLVTEAINRVSRAVESYGKAVADGRVDRDELENLQKCVAEAVEALQSIEASATQEMLRAEEEDQRAAGAIAVAKKGGRK